MTPFINWKSWNTIVGRQTVQPIFVSNISWKFHENLYTRFSILLLASTDPKNGKIDPVSKGLKATSFVHPLACNFPNWRGFTEKNTYMKGSNVVICVLFNLFWKFHGNLFSHFSAMFLKDRKTNKPTNKHELKYNLRRSPKVIIYANVGVADSQKYYHDTISFYVAHQITVTLREHHSVSNHSQFDFWFNIVFGLTPNRISSLRITIL